MTSLPHKTLLLLFLISFSIYAVDQKNTYNEVKSQYSRKEFKLLESEPMYKPADAALWSLLFAGLGHYYIDEPLRGKSFIQKELIIDIASLIPVSYLLWYIQYYTPPVTFSEYVSGEDIFAYLSIFLIKTVTPTAIAIIRTASAFDTIRIAKVKSVAYAKQKSNPLSLNIFPDIKHQTWGIQNHGVSCGLGVRLTF